MSEGRASGEGAGTLREYEAVVLCVFVLAYLMFFSFRTTNTVRKSDEFYLVYLGRKVYAPKVLEPSARVK